LKTQLGDFTLAAIGMTDFAHRSSLFGVCSDDGVDLELE
jgi:hypothetical protein